MMSTRDFVIPAAAAPGDLLSTTNFIVVPADWKAGDALRALREARGHMGWYVIVKYADHYGAIQAGRLALAIAERGEAQLGELSIPPIYALSPAQTSGLESIQLALVMENDWPVAVLYRPTRDFDPAAMVAFEQLTWASPKSPSVQETSDARARYVNTWFTDSAGGEALGRECWLERRRCYWLQLHIGPRLAQSIILAPRPIDPDLPPIPDEGLRLRVKLFSRDFEIKDDAAELRLFRTGPTERLYLRVIAPDTTGEARLRVGIYYENNLVQSILLHAQVGAGETTRGGHANWAEVEYGLSQDFADITQLKPRRVSIFVNDAPDGTHWVGVVGTPTEAMLDIGRDKMKAAVTEFRAKLWEMTADNRNRYRYGSDNSGRREQLTDDLKTLAYLGANLFQSVFYQDETMDLTRDLRQVLAGPLPAIVQVARLSSDFVFPWAALYDKRLLINRGKNQVCLAPLEHATPQAALQACGACSHDDPNTICLAGFWGFRHIVEQPLTVIKKGKPISVVREIKTAGPPTACMNVYVGEDLVLRAGHQDWLAAQVQRRGGAWLTSDDLDQVHTNLPKPQQLCYFYCHGGSKPGGLEPWLTVGRDAKLIPSDLAGLGLEDAWRFQNVRPLVFINACHSIEFTPEALSAFLPRFAAAGASGVVGTEVSIFEPLAIEFGQGLIEAFLNGEPIGQAVQRLRWQLLLKHNVLGLVYTPYCYADLRLAPGSQ